jgi:hypothetical protein
MKATSTSSLLLAAVALGSPQVASASPAKSPSIRTKGAATTIEITAANKVTVDRPFTLKVKASNKQGIEHLWITFQDRTYSQKGLGKKNIALNWKVLATKTGRHPIVVVAKNKMGDKTTKRKTVSVTSSKKRPKGPTHLTSKPPACSKGVDAAMDHCDAKVGMRSAKYLACVESSFYKRCLKKKKTAVKKIAVKKKSSKKKSSKKKKGPTKLAARTYPLFSAKGFLDAIPQYLTDRPPECNETTESWGNNTVGGITHTDCEGCFYEEAWTATEITITVGCCEEIPNSTAVDCVSNSETKPRPPS